MYRLLGLAILGGTMFVAGCANIVAPEQIHSDDSKLKPMRLSEAATKLDLRLEEGSYWGECYAHTATGSRFLIATDKATYWYNGLARSVEFPGVRYSRDVHDWVFPVSMFNSMAKDLGRLDLVVDTRKKVDVNDGYQPVRPEDVVVESPEPVVVPLPAPKAVQKPATQPAIKGVLTGRKIVLDAGHGGKDPGAIQNGVQEKVVALAVTKLVEARLRELGATVVMTRSGDTYPELAERADLANIGNADLFISIHANAASNEAASGIETWYEDKGQRGVASKSLASAINAGMVAATNGRDRGARADERGLRVLRQTTMPAVLVELGFLSNKDEAAKLSTADYQAKLAQGIVDGILRFHAVSGVVGR